MEPVSDKIELRREYDFSKTLSLTFQFLRQEFKPIIKLLAIYTLPFFIAGGIFFGVFMNSYFDFIGQIQNNPESFDSPSSILGMFDFGSLVAFSLLLGVGYVLLYLIAFAYPVEYVAAGNRTPSMAQVSRHFGVNILWFILIGIFLWILLAISAIFLIIPAIYLSIMFSLVYMVFLAEKRGFFETFGRSYNLLRGYFWPTLGGLLILGLIVGIVNYVLSIPAMVAGFAIGFNSLESTGTFGNFSLADKIIFGVTSAFSSLSYVLGIIPTTFLAISYYSIIETKEAPSLMVDVENINKDRDDNTRFQQKYDN